MNLIARAFSEAMEEGTPSYDAEPKRRMLRKAFDDYLEKTLEEVEREYFELGYKKCLKDHGLTS